MGATLDGSVFCWKTEGIKSERGEHAVSLHRAEADDRIADGVVADVALMCRPARIGVHAQHVVGGPRIVIVDLVGTPRGPALLPARLDLFEVVVLNHRFRLTAESAFFEARPRGDVRESSDTSTGNIWPSRGRSSAGRALDWQSRGSRVQVPSPPPKRPSRWHNCQRCACCFGRAIPTTIPSKTGQSQGIHAITR